ncbi:MAG: sugar transferase [Elusimicrobia bacterium]|nr:sugar transferase [Elusimicrobiota bacterium]
MNRGKRLFDLVFASLGLALLSLPMALIAILVKLTSKGPVLYWSDRIGVDNNIFRMPKFRTMRRGAPVVATHLLRDPGSYVTRIGRFLRMTSLDELPQLFCILSGELSFVGPRPALYNQADLIALRTRLGVQRLVPGLTGWAQIHGRDELPIAVKVEFDAYYLKHRSFFLDMRILLRTPLKVIFGDGVSH